MQKDVTSWHNRKVITFIFTEYDTTKSSILNIIEDELLAHYKSTDSLIAELHRVIDFMINYYGEHIMAVLQTIPVKILKSKNNYTKWVLYLK
jgi:hypothetical protein